MENANLSVMDIKSENTFVPKKNENFSKNDDFKKIMDSHTNDRPEKEVEKLKNNNSDKNLKSDEKIVGNKEKQSDKTVNEVKKIVKKITSKANEKSEKVEKLEKLLSDLGIEATEDLIKLLSEVIDVDSEIDFTMMSEIVSDVEMSLESEINVEELMEDLEKLIEVVDNLDQSGDVKSVKAKLDSMLKALEGKVEEVVVTTTEKQVTQLVENTIETEVKELSEEVKQSEVEVETDVEVKISDEDIVKNGKSEVSSNIEKTKETHKTKKVVGNETAKEAVLKNQDGKLVPDDISVLEKDIEEKENFKSELDFAVMSKVKQSKNIFTQIKDQVTTKFNSDNTEIKVQLNPKTLGKLELKLIIEKGTVIAEFEVENTTVKQAIESNLQDLKQSLQDKGYELEELSVTVGDEGEQQEHEEQKQQYQNFFDNLTNEDDQEGEDEIALLDQSRVLSLIRRQEIAYLG